MQEQIKRGRNLSLVLLGAVSVIFVVNVFYRLYLGPPDRSKRFMVLVIMLTFVALAYYGVRGMRAVISVVLFALALLNSLVLFAAMANHDFYVSVLIACIIAGFSAIGWLLLASKSVRAFEAARQKPIA